LRAKGHGSGRRPAAGADVTRIALIGSGPRPAQLAAEFALGGCSVTIVGEDAEGSSQLFEDALRFASGHGLAGPSDLERARALLEAGGEGPPDARLTLIVEALDDELALKAAGIGPLAAAHPEALVATTSEATSVTAVAEAAGTGERTVAARYGHPPILTPVVELLAARDTPPRLVDRVSQLLRAIGKRPVVVHREVPGMIAGRLETALLRECLWLLSRGVAEPEEIDAVVRDGLARAWSVAGPLGAAALRGAGPLEAIARAIGHEPQPANGLDGLSRALPDPDDLVAEREHRDDALAGAMRAERAQARSSARRGG
jgi:3-hydroxyacyl-CoA dehydrogenase